MDPTSRSPRGARSSARWRHVAAGLAVVLGLLAGGATTQASGSPHASSVLTIRVQGDELVNENGVRVRLLGVDRSGSEYECMASDEVFDGPSNAASVTAIANWHADAVRLPLNEDCWLGINGARTPASTYRDAVEAYVRLLEDHGLYVILDLHWAAPDRYAANAQWPMADATHAPKFWRSVAAAFRSNHGVLFDLFNEPYLEGWTCWLRGCVVSYDDGGTKVRYRTAGMQQLVDAVRSTGASTPLMLGGLQWASDESGWLAHEPSDPDHQLVVSFHTYNFSACSTKACWNRTIAPLALRVPVVTGEFGESGCTDSFDLRYMPWADARGISYLGWAWDSTGPPSYWPCSAGPALIRSYDGLATPYGEGLKRHLAMLAGKT